MTYHIYTFRFQFVSPTTGEITDLDEIRLPLRLNAFWQKFAEITDWLGDHVERRVLISRAGSDTVIDLIHHKLERLFEQNRETPAECETTM